MWLGQVPWAGRHWALPVLTVLAPSARYYQERGRRHKKLTDWARQMVLQLRRWLPQRSLVLVGDNGYAVLGLLHCCQSLSEPVTLIARLRLDAALYAPAPPRQPGQNGRPALKGARRPSLKALLEQPPATDQPQVTWTSATVGWYDGATRTVELTSQTAVWYRSGKPPVRIRWVLIRDPQGAFAPQALLCTDPSADPTQILEWFVLRWQLEVIFQEVRTHLGVETQRQWSDLAITPHHAGPAGTLFLDHPGRSLVARKSSHGPPQSCLVRQADANLRRRHRPGAPPPVAGVGGFPPVAQRPRYARTPHRSVPPTGGFPRLRRLKCAKSSLPSRTITFLYIFRLGSTYVTTSSPASSGSLSPATASSTPITFNLVEIREPA